MRMAVWFARAAGEKGNWAQKRMKTTWPRLVESPYFFDLTTIWQTGVLVFANSLCLH
jgi:hypothetical protein